KEGGDFGELASSISDCQATRAKGGEIGWASTPNALRVEPILTSPPKSPRLAVPTSAAARVVPGIGQDGGDGAAEAVSEAAADVEAGMEEILPLAARTALLDYKPGDVAIAPTGRGWHVIKRRHEERPATARRARASPLPLCGPCRERECQV
ncbi:unnamed protein product, partial [Hapterophycus canaliculatus]